MEDVRRLGGLAVAVCLSGVFSLLVGFVLAHTRPVEAGVLRESLGRCQGPFGFRTLYEETRDSVVLKEDGEIAFEGNGWVAATVCAPGSVTVVVSGQGALDEAARMTVLLGEEVLFDGGVEERRRLTFELRRPGRLSVGFTNDYYAAEVRKAALHNLHVIGENGCRGFRELNRALSGGVWSPETSTFVLAYDPSPVIEPCAAGRLTFSLSGERVAGEAARITIKQAGRPILNAEASPRLTPYSLQIGAGAVELQIDNAYGRLVANRSLTLHASGYEPLR